MEWHKANTQYDNVKMICDEDNRLVADNVPAEHANLIAALPELLTALQHIVETADAGWDREDSILRKQAPHTRESRDCFQAIGNIARDAIAKKEGNTP